MLKIVVRKEAIEHDFVVTVSKGDITVDDRYGARLVGNILRFSAITTINKQRVDGIKISDEEAKQIEEAMKKQIAELRERWDAEDKEREADRPAPELDETRYFLYSYGCDTGLLYPREYEEAIENILEKGVKPERVFRGSRDKTRKFPETWDSLIPQQYVKKDGEEYSAEGYDKVWHEDQWALPRELVLAEFERLRKEAKEKKRKKEEELEKLRSEKLEEARRTGRNVRIRSLGGFDGDELFPGRELGWVNVYEVATPEGKIVKEEEPTY